MQNKTLKISEIFTSIQGESVYAGFPCLFFRLYGCPLRCHWCDTEYSYEGKSKIYQITSLIQLAQDSPIKYVEVTGGEPLAQPNSIELIGELNNIGKKVLLETSGAYSIEKVDRRTHVVMDFKCPDSGEEAKNLFSNLQFIKPTDDIKFVIASREDYDWANSICDKYNLEDKSHNLIYSPVFGKLDPDILSEWLLKDHLNRRLQLQLHKIIWPSKSHAF